MLLLKQSTAVTVKIGPFLDSADGDTEEGALAISQADVRLSKNGGNMAQKNDANACVYDETGWYDCDLDATDTNTLGRLQLMVHEAGALSVWHEFMVVPANVYDSIVAGSDTLDVQVAGMDAGTVTAAAIATGAIDADSTAADYLAEINAEVADVLTVDTIADLAQAQPPATPTFEEAVMYLYSALRNANGADATTKYFYNNAAVLIWKKTIGDDGVDYTEDTAVSGP